MASERDSSSFKAFRKWAVVEAGFFDTFILPDNTIHLEAKSISFPNLSEAQFFQVYMAVLITSGTPFSLKIPQLSGRRQLSHEAAGVRCMKRKTNLRKTAKGGECIFHSPGICSLAGTCVTGCKPDDEQGAISCNICHDVIDGRVKPTIHL
ncbi:DUF1367 family protein [Enterobacter ludwigii]